ncbi:MAG: alpha/beta hydrolase [Dyadobacter sp.]|uniref:alpha/beta fold hydrolase n=1 Tax=Dyadobacter sp. TaxID=1914288 RepID=UPI001B2EC6DD|nr:alpha/beta hydrolase [Dyadobacter sp.]MBO9611810.1 alpha/beta hydrolase [Dyadobacter sp.]
MKKTAAYITLMLLTAGYDSRAGESINRSADRKDTLTFQSGYLPINGIRMYYQIHGNGKPIVLIHGGGSTIETTFGRVIPLLAQNRKVIAVELQAHGRTTDRSGTSHLNKMRTMSRQF